MILFIVCVTLASILILFLVKIFLINRPNVGDRIDLSSKLVVLTGGTQGIGFEAALDILESGSIVVLASRSIDNYNSAISQISEPSKVARCYFIKLDLGDLNSIKQFCNDYRQIFGSKKIDFIINNAATINDHYFETSDGIEKVLQVNYIGPIIFTLKLLAFLSRDAKIINVTCKSHRDLSLSKFENFVVDYDIGNQMKFNYVPWDMYSLTKFGNILFTNILDEFFKSKNMQICVVSVNPGEINLDYHGKISKFSGILSCCACICFPCVWYCMKSTSSGAQPILNLVYSDNNKILKGRYYEYFNVGVESELARERKNVCLFMGLTAQIINRSFQDNNLDLNQFLDYLNLISFR